MILVRDIFQLKFGKAKEAINLWKDGSAIIKKLEYGPERLLTDLVGPSYYTFVMESTFEGLSDLEKGLSKVFGNEEWSRWYQKFLPLVESGRREIFNIVE
jgi:hypothetical protein